MEKTKPLSHDRKRWSLGAGVGFIVYASAVLAVPYAFPLPLLLLSFLTGLLWSAFLCRRLKPELADRMLDGAAAAAGFVVVEILRTALAAVDDLRILTSNLWPIGIATALTFGMAASITGAILASLTTRWVRRSDESG